jgi:SnoaL-like domain
MRPAPLIVVALVLSGLGGCDVSSSDDPEPARSAAPPARHYSYAARVIRGWLLALERQDYDGAAYYFAPGAIIDQGHPYRLRDQSAARAFNAALPCRADLTALKHEGETVLASFRLRRGPGGDCSGVVRVRYTIRKGKFTEWRQLPEPPPPEETV